MLRSFAVTRRVAARLVGERPLPFGEVARTRRVLRRATRGHSPERVLVVGPGLAARQALRHTTVDVAGTSPHSVEVNVCSRVRGSGSLPPERWDMVIVTDPAARLNDQLSAVVPACRPGARLLIVGRGGEPQAHAVVARSAAVERVIIGSGVRVLVAKVGS